MKAVPVEKRIYVPPTTEEDLNKIERMAIAVGLVNLSHYSIAHGAPKDADGNPLPGFELYQRGPDVEWGWFGGSALLIDGFELIMKSHGFDPIVEPCPALEVKEPEELTIDDILIVEEAYTNGDYRNPKAIAIINKHRPGRWTRPVTEEDEIQLGFDMKDLIDDHI